MSFDSQQDPYMPTGLKQFWIQEKFVHINKVLFESIFRVRSDYSGVT